jgi:hypothetical protein
LKSTIKKHYRSTTRVKDEKFSVDDIGDYDLVLSFSPEHFKCAVSSEKLGRCVFFENFDFTVSLDKNEVIEQCRVIFDEHAILQAGFWKSVRCVVSDEFFTLVPKQLFHEKKATKVLDFCYPEIDSRSKEKEVFNPNSGPAASVFTVHKKLNSFLKKFYPKINIQYLHELTCVLEGVVTTADTSNKACLSAFIHGNRLTIIALDGGKLRFFNNFTFVNPEDAVYYILSVMEKLDIPGHNGKLVFYGDIVKKSPVFDTASKYIAEVQLGERPKLFYFNYEFDEIPQQWHFETFCAYLCK